MVSGPGYNPGCEAHQDSLHAGTRERHQGEDRRARRSRNELRPTELLSWRSCIARKDGGARARGRTRGAPTDRHSCGHAGSEDADRQVREWPDRPRTRRSFCAHHGRCPRHPGHRVGHRGFLGGRAGSRKHGGPRRRDDSTSRGAGRRQHGTHDRGGRRPLVEQQGPEPSGRGHPRIFADRKGLRRPGLRGRRAGSRLYRPLVRPLCRRCSGSEAAPCP